MAHPKECFICSTGQDTRAMAQRGEPWCSDNCHKKAAELLEVTQSELTSKVFWEAYDTVDGSKQHLLRKVHDLVKQHKHSEALRVYGVRGVQSQEVQFSPAQPGNWSR